MTWFQEGYTYSNMKPKKGVKPMRVKVTTTIRGDLWEELRVRAVREKTDCNTILEGLIEVYLKRVGQKGGGR